MAVQLSRRMFVVGLSLLALSACTSGCTRNVSYISSDKSGTLPNTLELLSLEAPVLANKLQAEGYSYDKSTGEFTALGSYANHNGTILLTVLGEDNGGPSGRWLSPERLEEGAPPQAVTATLFFSHPTNKPDLTGESAWLAIKRELKRSHISEDALIGISIGEGEDSGSAASFAGAECSVNNHKALWACTIVNGRGITVCCSHLDYYARSMHVENDYDIIAKTWGPWDISINRNISN